MFKNYSIFSYNVQQDSFLQSKKAADVIPAKSKQISFPLFFENVVVSLFYFFQIRNLASQLNGPYY